MVGTFLLGPGLKNQGKKNYAKLPGRRAISIIQRHDGNHQGRQVHRVSRTLPMKPHSRWREFSQTPGGFVSPFFFLSINLKLKWNYWLNQGQLAIFHHSLCSFCFFVGVTFELTTFGMPTTTSNQPTNQPTDRPTDRPTNQPTNQPTSTPPRGGFEPLCWATNSSWLP